VNERDAIHLVESKREELDLDPDMEFEYAEKAIVPYMPNPDEPGPVEDRIAWVVTYSCNWGFVEILVDDLGREILGIRRSA
jgi:hypothetical protein